MTDRPPTGVSGAGHPPYEEEFRMIGHILEKDADQIMERWFERAGAEQVHASPQEREEAMDDLLDMLRSLGRRLHQQSSHALEVASHLAREHGEQRFSLNWDIMDLVRDYEILQGVILEHLGQVLDERLSYRQAMIVATIVNGATGHAVKSYSTTMHELLNEQVRRQQVELRQLALDLTDAEHHERQRIAGRLHDDLQQILVALRMRLSRLANNASADRGAVDQIVGLSDRAIESARNLATDLYPHVLEQHALPEVVEWLGETFQQWYGLQVTVESQMAGDRAPEPLPLRRVVYDVIRELLFNVVKHARTEQAWVRVGCEDAFLRIEVEDKGAGSSDVNDAVGRSYGLGSVARRIRQIGGKLEMDSRPSEGTRAVLMVPMATP